MEFYCQQTAIKRQQNISFIKNYSMKLKAFSTLAFLLTFLCVGANAQQQSCGTSKGNLRQFLLCKVFCFFFSQKKKTEENSTMRE